MEETILTTANRYYIGNAQTNVEGRVEPSNEDEIVKILCASCKAYVDAVEVSNGYATMSGQVMFNCIYINEEGRINSSTSVSPLTLRLDDKRLEDGDKPIWKTEVVECRIKNATKEEATTTTIVEVCLDVIKCKPFSIFEANNDTIKCKKEVVKIAKCVTNGNAKIVVNEDENCKQKIAKVLSNCVSVQIKDSFAGTGYFTVEGEVNLDLIALCGESEEDRTIKTISDSISFKEEIENEMSQKDDIILVSAFIKPEDVEIGHIEETESNMVSVNVPIYLEYVILRNDEMEIVKDAYSITNKCLLSYSDLETNDYMFTKSYRDRIDGNLTIEENEPRIAKIMATNCGNVSIVKCYCADGFVVVEGLANTCVVYETDEDEIPISSVQVETPFSTKISCEYAKEGCELLVRADLCQTTGKAKKGKDIELDMEICFTIDVFDQKVYTNLKDVELTEPYPKQDYALQVYVAPKGSTLWEIAKKLHTTEDIILNQNPNVVFPLEESTGIVYFVGN